MSAEAKELIVLKKAKAEAAARLYTLESDIGHNLLTKAGKILSKDVLAQYKNFDAEAEILRDEIKKIQELAAKRDSMQKAIGDKKKQLSAAMAESGAVYKTLGQALFTGYSAAYTDFFGTTYTEILLHNQKIEDIHKNEQKIRSEMEKSGFFPRMMQQVKANAIKTQAVLLEQKRDRFLEEGAKTAFKSGKLTDLSVENQLDKNSEKVLKLCGDLQSNIEKQEADLDVLMLDADNLAAEFSKRGAAGSGEKRIREMIKQIEQEEKLQTEFAAAQGHEYACRYVSPDGEILAEFPPAFAAVLVQVQTQKKNIRSYSQQMEILRLGDLFTGLESSINTNKKKIDANVKKIEALSLQNDELSEKIKVDQDEQKKLIDKRDALIKDERIHIE